MQPSPQRQLGIEWPALRGGNVKLEGPPTSGSMDLIVSLGQRLPAGLRSWLVRSPLAPPMRWFLNRSHRSGERLRVVPLASPLAGHRMLVDWYTQKSFVFGVYEPRAVALLGKFVQTGDIAIDVGAHIGYYTLLLRKHVGADGRVIAFEPVPEDFEVLQRNLMLNGYTNVRLENAAVAEFSGDVRIERRDTDPLSSVSSLSSNADLQVRSVALDDYFGADETISFVKIDVEGAEDRVLRGMKRILANQRPTLIVEIHSHDASRAAQMLRAAGYRTSAVAGFSREYQLLALPG